jgi:glycosyltransferase involved in cell wall biosynthesis
MVKPKSHSTSLKKKYFPLVSVCTPTFNRRPFIPTMLACFANQTYPKDRIEWIIVDDGTDKVKDVIEAAGVPQIKYFALPDKLPLGAKRNFMHSHCKGSIIVYMDDDDYYPPERISHAVDMLQENRNAMCAGSSEIYIYFKHLGRMKQFGPYGPNHATAGTFAFRAELLKTSRYEESAAVAEERAFLKDYTVPFVQLDPMKTILVFSHEHNTFDKRKLLNNPHPDFIKDTVKKVEDFIKLDKERDIKKFFMDDIDGILAKYVPGEPKMKPDVLKQITEIEASRDKMMMAEQVKNGGGQIMMNQPGKDPVPLTITQIAELLRNQQEIMAQQEARIRELEFMNQQLQGIIVENAKQQKSMPLAPISNAPCAPISNAPCAPISNDQPWIKEISKSEPLFRIN